MRQSIIKTLASKAAAAALKPFGLQLRRIANGGRDLPASPTDQQTDPDYSLFRYLDARGEFDYERYRAAQVEANKRKIDKVWAQPGNIKMLADNILRRGIKPTFGICHGTRRGVEQQWFSVHLGCPVLGTDISDTAEQFPNTIEWDFHEVKPEWIGAADFIYSNSFDHAYDPAKCLDAWMSCLKSNGLLVIEHSTDDIASRESDPFGAPIQVMPYLVLKWGGGRYSVREILEAPAPTEFLDRNVDVWFLVIERN